MVLNSHIFVENYENRISAFFGFPLFLLILLSPNHPFPCNCLQQNAPPWPACECVKCVAVFAVIHQVSNYVGGCYCQLCWASPPRRCRTVRKLIRCEVLPTLAIVRPEPATSTVHTVRTSAQPAQWGQKGSSCMEINFAPVAVQVAATKLTIKFGCVLCENTNSCPA